MKKSIKISKHDDDLLRTLYLQFRVPTDQFPKRPTFWNEFTGIFNDATGRNESPEDILHYMVTRRKRGIGQPGRWPTLDGTHEKMPCLPFSAFGIDFSILKEIYEELRIGSDNFAFDANLGQILANMYAERTGNAFQPGVLWGALVTWRKHGRLGKLSDLPPINEDEDLGFGDINDVG